MRRMLTCAVAAVAMLVAEPAMTQVRTAPGGSEPGDLPVAKLPEKPMSRGEWLAIAGDCAGCHASPSGGSEMAGGLALKTPMGTVFARNITPDPQTGIGGWSLADFDAALRQGKSKAVGRLYPAMPYTSYRYMTDDDVKALYDYIMKDVKPVRNAVTETDMGFPFWRVSLAFWDGMFADNGKPPVIANASEQVRRGQYLVDVMGHCGECHTPRGVMFQSKASTQHLGGAVVGGWYAPNISAHESGIGKWPDESLKQFLIHGKVRGADANAHAGGDMGLAVQMSLSKLPASDIDAMVAYLKATPPVASAPIAPVPASIAPLAIAAAEPPNGDYKSFFDASTRDGAVLYLSACAACHGVDGSLADGAGPSLAQNIAVRAGNPVNVVQVIASGINPGGLDKDHLMPPFRGELDNAQIAAVASYVRNRFGGIPDAVTEGEVADILDGSVGVPWLLLHARLLAWLGVFVALAAAGYLVFRSRHRGRRHQQD